MYAETPYGASLDCALGIRSGATVPFNELLVVYTQDSLSSKAEPSKVIQYP